MDLEQTLMSRIDGESTDRPSVKISLPRQGACMDSHWEYIADGRSFPATADAQEPATRRRSFSPHTLLCSAACRLPPRRIWQPDDGRSPEARRVALVGMNQQSIYHTHLNLNLVF